eukprot:gene11382-12568_t
MHLINSRKENTPPDFASWLDNSNSHVSLEASNIISTIKKDLEKVSSSSQEISLLMSEIDSKNQEISKLKKKLIPLEKVSSEKKELQVEIQALKDHIAKQASEIDMLDNLNSQFKKNAESSSIKLSNMEIEANVLKEKVLSLSEINKICSDHTKTLIDQLKTKDALINTLTTRQDCKKELPKAPSASNKENNNNVLILGDSIVKHIQTNKILSKNPEINVNKIIAYTWSQVEETVADQNLTLPDNIVIHTGTNDLRDGISADEIINSAKKTADIILSRNANAHLTFSAIIPRGDNELLDIERQDVNLKMLKWCHNQERIEFVDNTNLSVRGGINVKMYAQDKIHLNETGTKLLASNIGFSLKSQLQIAHLYQVPNRNPRGQGFRRRGSRNPQFDARGGHRGRSWSPAEYE